MSPWLKGVVVWAGEWFADCGPDCTPKFGAKFCGLRIIIWLVGGCWVDVRGLGEPWFAGVIGFEIVWYVGRSWLDGVRCVDVKVFAFWFVGVICELKVFCCICGVGGVGNGTSSGSEISVFDNKI